MTISIYGNQLVFHPRGLPGFPDLLVQRRNHVPDFRPGVFGRGRQGQPDVCHSPQGTADTHRCTTESFLCPTTETSEIWTVTNC